MSFAERYAGPLQRASVSVLGGAVLYRPVAGGEGVSIRGIWSSPYREFDGDRGKVALRTPTIDVRRADVVACFGNPPAEGDVIEVDDGVLGLLKYKVNGEPEGDGQGMEKLYLYLIE